MSSSPELLASERTWIATCPTVGARARSFNALRAVRLAVVLDLAVSDLLSITGTEATFPRGGSRAEGPEWLVGIARAAREHAATDTTDIVYLPGTLPRRVYDLVGRHLSDTGLAQVVRTPGVLRSHPSLRPTDDVRASVRRQLRDAVTCPSDPATHTARGVVTCLWHTDALGDALGIPWLAQHPHAYDGARTLAQEHELSDALERACAYDDRAPTVQDHPGPF